MTNLGSILKSRDITVPTKIQLIKAMAFPVVMYGCESRTVKKAERWKVDAFKLWCWRRLLRVPWTTRGYNQSMRTGLMRSEIVGHDWATELNWTEVGTNKRHKKPQNKTQTILKQNMHFLEKIWEFPWIRYSKLKKGAPQFHEMNISLDSKVFPSS